MTSVLTRPVPTLRRVLRVAALFACVCALAAAARSDAWGQAGSGTISGTVVDKKTGRAIAFANIAIPQLKTGALSDSKGEFLIGSVPAGTYTLQVNFTGYGAQTVAGVTVTAGQVTPVKVAMEEIVVKTEE